MANASYTLLFGSSSFCLFGERRKAAVWEDAELPLCKHFSWARPERPNGRSTEPFLSGSRMCGIVFQKTKTKDEDEIEAQCALCLPRSKRVQVALLCFASRPW